MKKFISLILVFCILNISCMDRSEAVVGLFINSKTTRVVGGIVTTTSVATAAGAGAVHAIYGYTYGAVFFATLGFVGAYLGIILLDEKNGDLNFMPLSENAAKRLGVNKSELEIYNSQVEELNIVKEVIESQVTDNVGQAEVRELWNEYKTNLAPETMEVAAKIVIEIFNKKIVLVK